ncbi:UDP-N-acetylmuramate dehydrogenase [Candidatus Microgenomates bacterium]|nr:UDP-N-acetylmuramate dehydrogenase [Candidatus Microgenomates bacterium]
MLPKTLQSKLEKELGEGRIKRDEKLALHTSWRIGGLTRFWFEAKNQDELVKAVIMSRKLSLPLFVLGGGTNVLIGDKTFPGLVIKNNSGQIKILGVGGKIVKGERQDSRVLVEADSGVVFNRLVRFTLDEALSNFESFLGQPGSVGGAIYINAHFMKDKKYVGDYVSSVKLLDSNNQVKEVGLDYLQFGYDYSKIQETQDIVLSATFNFTRFVKEKVWERANQTTFYRQTTQPSGYPTAGCTFRNISYAQALFIPTPEYTTSAGYLIDQCGLKGKVIGGAQISDQHANFILNVKNASAQDVLDLINLCKQKVKEKFNIELHEEVVLKGVF